MYGCNLDSSFFAATDSGLVRRAVTVHSEPQTAKFETPDLQASRHEKLQILLSVVEH